MGGYSGIHLLKVGTQGQNADIDQVAEVVVASGEATAVDVKALPGNTGVVYVTFDGTTPTPANGYPLSASESTGWMPVKDNDLANIKVIASADNQGVAYRTLR